MAQLALFAAASTRTWADVRPGDRLDYRMPGSEWCGTWTVRRTEPHPTAAYLLIVTLTDGSGRTWVPDCRKEPAC